MVKNSKKTKNKKKVKSGDSALSNGKLNNNLWKAIFSQMGSKLGKDLDKRLKATAEIVSITLEKQNNKKIKILEDKIKELEKKIQDISLQEFFR